MKKLLLPAILLLSCITMAYRFKDVPSLTKKAIKKTYSKKGDKIVEQNFQAVDATATA